MVVKVSFESKTPSASFGPAHDGCGQGPRRWLPARLPLPALLEELGRASGRRGAQGRALVSSPGGRRAGTRVCVCVCVLRAILLELFDLIVELCNSWNPLKENVVRNRNMSFSNMVGGKFQMSTKGCPIKNEKLHPTAF